MCTCCVIKYKFCYLMSKFWVDFLKSEALLEIENSSYILRGVISNFCKMCFNWLHFLGFNLVHFLNFNFIFFFLHGSSVSVCSLYLENLPFHLASKAVREQSHQCNLSRCGSEWIKPQEMVWDCFSRSLFFSVFCIQGRLKAQVGEECFQVLKFLKCRSRRP